MELMCTGQVECKWVVKFMQLLNCHIVETGNESYRLQHSTLAAQTKIKSRERIVAFVCHLRVFNFRRPFMPFLTSCSLDRFWQLHSMVHHIGTHHKRFTLFIIT